MLRRIFWVASPFIWAWHRHTVVLSPTMPGLGLAVINSNIFFNFVLECTCVVSPTSDVTQPFTFIAKDIPCQYLLQLIDTALNIQKVLQSFLNLKVHCKNNYVIIAMKIILSTVSLSLFIFVHRSCVYFTQILRSIHYFCFITKLIKLVFVGMFFVVVGGQRNLYSIC